MYDFVSGPLVWIAFCGFLGGAIYKLYSTALLARRERTVYPTYDWAYGLRSVGHWLLPLGSRSMRMHPVFTIFSFAFHICLLLTPLLAMGHAVLWQQAWGLSWWSLPPLAVDVMTLIVIVVGGIFLLRRLTAPEVRNVSAWQDYLILIVVIAPFVTGFVAHRQWLPYEAIIVLHILSGVAWLLAIPFTRLTHMFWFLFSRAYMGSEFGAVRQARDW